MTYWENDKVLTYIDRYLLQFTKKFTASLYNILWVRWPKKYHMGHSILVLKYQGWYYAFTIARHLFDLIVNYQEMNVYKYVGI